MRGPEAVPSQGGRTAHGEWCPTANEGVRWYSRRFPLQEASGAGLGLVNWVRFDAAAQGCAGFWWACRGLAGVRAPLHLAAKTHVGELQHRLFVTIVWQHYSRHYYSLLLPAF